MNLVFSVRHQTMSLLDTKVTPRQGSAQYLKLRFVFASSEWASLRKTLYISSGEYSEAFILSSDIFEVPTYYTQQPSFAVTLLGDAGKQVVPTNVVTVSLDESNSLWVASSPDPANSAYVTLLQSIGDLAALETEDRSSVVAALNEVLRRTASGAWFEPDETLILEGGVLSVNTTSQVEQDNTLPITSAGVYATVGNIEALLKTI